MTRYKISFFQGDTLDLSKDQFTKFMDTLSLINFNTSVVFMSLDDDIPFIQVGSINSIIREEVNEAVSSVIKPQTPSEIREEQAREEANRDITLEAQLENEAEA